MNEPRKQNFLLSCCVDELAMMFNGGFFDILSVRGCLMRLDMNPHPKALVTIERFHGLRWEKIPETIKQEILTTCLDVFMPDGFSLIDGHKIDGRYKFSYFPVGTIEQTNNPVGEGTAL